MADKETSNDDFLSLARKRFAASAEDEKDLRAKFISDLKFASPDGDEQWDAQIKLQREQAGRPAMSFPRCHVFVQQVSNEARQNKPQIKFSPRLDADNDTAEIYEGLARFIQYASDAQVAYETAIEYSAGASFGYYRFLTDYADDEGDDLDLAVVPVLDPLAIYGVLVPSCFNRKVMYAFVVEDMPKEEFKIAYPDSEVASLSWAEAEKASDGWVGTETVRVAEYWYVEEGKAEKGKRKGKSKVKFCKTNGMEILKDTATDWPGSTIPIIPVLGKQMIMNGEPHLFSVVRPQKSAQILINYSKSRIAETLSTSPISPFMVAEGQIEGYEKQWETLNVVQRPFLTYKVVDAAGRPIPPPQRQTFEPPIQSLSSFVVQEVEDMKATTGIFDASLGISKNEVSGQAILRRKQQTELTTMHFMDNLTRSFKKGGDVIAELIPIIYDAPREIEILGEDEAPKVVMINQKHTDANGKTSNFDMTKGKYSVVVTTGKAFDTKRMESFDTMQQLVQTAPNMLPMFGDILFKNSDMAGADIVAERFKMMLPPNLQQAADGQQPIPPEVKAQMAQLQQQAAQASQTAQQLQLEKHGEMWKTNGKIQEIQAKFQADMALEDKKLLTQLAVAEANTKAQNVQQRQQTYDELQAQFHEQAHETAMATAGAGQAQQMAQQGQPGQQAQDGQQPGQFQHMAQNDQGHTIGSNDGQNWQDAQTGEPVGA